MKKLLDFKKLVLRVWLILWAILLILLIMKFCFGVWYPIVVKNQTFINICDWLDKHYLIYSITVVIFYMLNCNLFILTATKTKIKNVKWYIALILNILFLGNCLLKRYSQPIGFIIEVLLLLGFSIFFNFKVKRFRKIFNVLIPLIVYMLVNLWQLNILLVRNVDIDYLTNNVPLIYYVMQIDYYIFLIISYIGVLNMGWGGIGWLWNKDITELKALREKELLKSKPNQKLLTEIDRVIKSKEEMGE